MQLTHVGIGIGTIVHPIVSRTSQTTIEICTRTIVEGVRLDATIVVVVDHPNVQYKSTCGILTTIESDIIEVNEADVSYNTYIDVNATLYT